MCIRYLQADPDSFDLRDLKCKFDVILIEPPLEEYYRESGIIANERFWTWDDVSFCKFLSNSTTCEHWKIFDIELYIFILFYFLYLKKKIIDHEAGHRGNLIYSLFCIPVVWLRRRP